MTPILILIHFKSTKIIITFENRTLRYKTTTTGDQHVLAGLLVIGHFSVRFVLASMSSKDQSKRT